MSKRIDRYNKAMLTIIAACLLWLTIFSVGSGSVQAQTTVLSDKQLFELARDTWRRATMAPGDERNYMYAMAHMYALQQRNPAFVQNNPAFAKQLADGQAFAGRRVLVWLKIAEQASPQVREAAGRGIGVLPNIVWPNPQ
jgi:hypothetical protein